MKKEISEALIDFYEKILAPEFSEIKKVQSEQGERFIDVLGHFDSVYKQFDRLEDEYHTITHGLKRIEDQLDGDIKNRKVIETRFRELKQQFEGMQLRLAAIEKELAGHQENSPHAKR
ncbi:hypothetical protein KJ797_04425 [Patescibacteria group bacterium]|nr:hypothetical protein [Patescibacteria group bacterium]